jgi:hypothetical protein
MRDHINLDTLYKEQIAQEQEEKNKLYKRIKELSDENHKLKMRIQSSEFQNKEYQEIIKTLSERLAKNG